MIRLSGYILDEKVQIAEQVSASEALPFHAHPLPFRQRLMPLLAALQYIRPAALEDTGLKPEQLGALPPQKKTHTKTNQHIPAWVFLHELVRAELEFPVALTQTCRLRRSRLWSRGTVGRRGSET